MYERHWNLSARPFQNDFDPKMFVPSGTHEEALTRLLYAFAEDKGLMLLTGPAGCGKSYTARFFAAECERRGFPAAYVGIPDSDPIELIVQISRAFGIEVESRDKYRVIEAMTSHLKSAGGKSLLVLDEVQDVGNPKCLEEVKLLSSLTLGSRRIFTIVLAGSAALLELVSRDEALATRVEISYHMHGMTIEETIRYVAKRLENAGRRETIFSPDSLEAIHAMTGGLPRLINTLCDLSLFTAAGRKLDWVGLEIVEEAHSEMSLASAENAQETVLGFSLET